MQSSTDTNRPADPAKSLAYTGELRPLIGLQALAVAWVVLNQFRDHPIPGLGETSGLVAKGYLGAALSFVIAGFLLAHLYGRAEGQGRFSYLALLRRTLIRLYPLQLAGTLAMIVLVVTGRATGVTMEHALFRGQDLIPPVLLLQAWGTLPTDTWNFPTWFASALWFGTLTFPVVGWIALRQGRPALLLIGAALALFWVMFAAASARDVLFTDMTSQIGALQTVPAFLLGAGLYQLGVRYTPPRAWGPWVALAAVAWIVMAASLRVTDAAIWPAFAPLVFGLAEPATVTQRFLGGPVMAYLGRISLAVFMFYLPTDIVYFHTLRLLFGPPSGPLAWMELAGVFPAILLAGVLAHHLIEAPVRRAFNRWRRRA